MAPEDVVKGSLLTRGSLPRGQSNRGVPSGGQTPTFGTVASTTDQSYKVSQTFQPFQPHLFGENVKLMTMRIT